MASIRNFTATDQGVNWDLSFEWNNDQQTGPWTLWEGQLPRDLDDIGEDVDERNAVLLQLSQSIARGQGVPL
jgi:hypothetical protein